MTVIRISDVRAKAEHDRRVAANAAAETALQASAQTLQQQLTDAGWENACICREGAFWKAEGDKNGQRMAAFAATPDVAYAKLTTP